MTRARRRVDALGRERSPGQNEGRPPMDPEGTVTIEATVTRAQRAYLIDLARERGVSLAGALRLVVEAHRQGGG